MAPLQLREAQAGMRVAYTVGRPQWSDTNPAAFHDDAYRKLTLIFRCANLLAQSVSEAPIRVYRDRDGQQETLPDHRLRQLVTRPNPLMGEAGLMYNFVIRMAIFGFAALEIERSSTGAPIQLWPLRSEWLRPIPRNNAAFDWEYKIPGNQPTTIVANDIIVVPFAALGNDDPRGIGPLEVAIRETSLLNTMQDYLKAFFDGGALPAYGLILDPDTDFNQDDADTIRHAWREMINSPDPPILESIRDIKRLGFDYNELAYIDLRDVSEIAICQAFGVPGSLVGQRFAQERNTFTNYGEARLSFYQDTVQKLWARIDDALTRSLLPELDTRGDVHMEFDVSKIEALQEDQGAVIDRMLRGLQAGGVSRADYKRSLGLPIEPSDDVYLMPFSVIEVPVGQAVPPRSSVSATDDTRALPAGTERRNRLPLERRAAMQTRSLRIYVQAARRWEPEFDKYFRAQMNRVIDAVTGERSMAGIESRAINPDAIDWNLELEELNELVGKLWDQMGEQATNDADALIPSPIGALPESEWDIANPWVQDVLSNVGGRVVDITETTQRDIQRVVSEALAEGTSPDDLASRLKGLYEETYNGRSRAIARTESQVSYNLATAQGYGQRGVTEVELMDNPMHDTDPGTDGLTCAERDGRIVPLSLVQRHVFAEHPNGSMAIAPVLQDWS
jgi:HK97 family phage portal protein